MTLMKPRSYVIKQAALLLYLVCSIALADSRSDRIKAFDDLVARVQRGDSDVTENDMSTILNEARDLARPFSAEAAIKAYSVARPDLPAPLLLMAADNAFLAGDFRTSVARYKNYLASAVPDKNSSDAAAMMLTIMLDFLGAGDEAYSFMAQDGRKFRASESIRRFDHWFLETAARKGDVFACANMLVDVFSEKMPVEKEKFFYWTHLDWMMNTLRSPAPGHYQAIPALKQLIALVRAENTQLLKYSLIAANLEFHAAIAGKTAQEQEELFAPVAAAAKAYFDCSPTAAALQNIEHVFSSGFSGPAWAICQKQKQEFFVYAFGKLSDADRVAMITWMPQNAGHLAAPDQWAALCDSFPKAFADAEQFVYPQSAHDLYRKQAPFLQGRPSTYAAVVNALAAGNDLDTMARHLLEKESWHLELPQCYDLIKNRLWPVFRSFPRPEGAALSNDYYSTFLVKLGSEQLLKSPIPILDLTCASEVMNACWEAGSSADMAGSLRMLEWIPYSEKERQAVFGMVYDAFKKWVGDMNAVAEARAIANEKIKIFEQANNIKTAAEAAKKAAEATAEQTAQAAAAADADDAAKSAAAAAAAEAAKAADAWADADKQTAQAAGAANDAKEVLAKYKDAPAVNASEISAIEEAFQAALNTASFNPEKAPNALCGNLANLLAAARDGNKNEYEKQGREIYAQFKDFEVKKTPYGAGMVQLVVSNRLESFDTLDFQLEILADQLSRWTPQAPTQAVNLVRNTIVSGRQGWPAAVPQTDRENAQKMIDLLEKTLLTQLDKKQFWPVLFEWFRTSRKGQGWRDDDSGLVVLGKMIAEKTLLEHPDYRLVGKTAAATYMWLVQNEFIKLKDEYPPATFFDDIYVQECVNSGEMDFNYWTYGSDSGAKIVNMAMAKLQGLTVLPCVYSEFNATNDLYKWHNQCLRMNAELRKARGVNEQERAKLIAMLDGAFGNTRFDEFACGSSFFVSDATTADAEGRDEMFRKLSDYVKRGAQLPARQGPPSLRALESLKEITLPEADVLLSFFPALTPSTWMTGMSYEKAPSLLYGALLSGERHADLLRVSPYFWKMAKDLGNTALFRDLAGNSTQLLEKNLPDLAAKYSISGLDIVGSALPEDARIVLMGNRMKALVGIGDTIPVDRHDPSYPIFASQNAYLAGNLQNAWELYLTRPNQVLGMFKDLDPEFSLWLIKMNTETQEYTRAEELAQGMMQWLDSLPGGFDRNLQGRVMIAYADIAFSRQEFPRARALYQRIVSDKAFDGTRAKHEAEFRIADVDRATRNYDSAVALLEKLARERDRWIQIESCYQLALIRFEQEDYVETARLLDYLFGLEPSHVAGKLLEGKLNLRMKRYQKAAEIEVGLASVQRVIVPGKPLNIYLEDRNLSIAGKSREIQVRVWTDSGDEELVSLLLSSYSKTKFEGSLPTEIAPPARNDRMLQVLGNDSVYYDYSEAFKQAHNIADSQPMSMSVASDSVLLVSSGALVSEEEEQEKGFMRLMDQARRAEDLSRILDERRMNTIVRPGNKIYVRVVDLDKSVSPGLDTVTVKVSAYSGDSFPSFVLKEVKPYSGVFEGEIPTARAGALAYATDSTEGRLPFYAISEGAFPPWMAFQDNARPKSFSVDLNDNVMLGDMNVLADVAGHKLKEFYVQISFDNKNFLTVGRWPTQHKGWDGTPVFEFVGANDGALNSAERIRQYIESDSVGKPAQRVFVPLKDMIEGDDKGVVKFNLNEARVGGRYYAARFRAAFYVPSRLTKLFKLEQQDPARIKCFMTLDGEGSDDPRHPNVIRRPLLKGIHYLDIFFSAALEEKGSFELSVDTDTPPYAVLCPVSMFDPIANPDIRSNLPDQTAAISSDANQTSFDIKFAPNTRGRVIKLIISDFETDAPAIRRISLASADGRQILPVEHDVSVGENDVLSLVAGDRISIIYEDSKCVTEGKEAQERFMTASYHNGDIYACVLDRENYIPLYRFVSGEKFDVMITDTDRDESDKPDILNFTAKTELGEPIAFRALETEPHSGRFVGSVFTVTNNPTRPNELRVEPTENVLLSYEDEENTDPGIPWTRTYTVEQVTYDPPELRVYDVASIPLDQEQIARLRDGQAFTRIMAKNRREYVVPTRDLVATRPLKPDLSAPAKIIAEGPLLVELTYPTAALASNSIAEICVQTRAARDGAGVADDDMFNPDIPGSVRIRTTPSDFGTVNPPSGYLSVFIRGDPYASTPLRDGRFSFNVRKAFGTIEGDTTIFGGDDPAASGVLERDKILFIRSNDEIFVGFQYRDLAGESKWIVKRVELTSDMFMDVMDRYYQEIVENIFVGQNLYLRINHRSADTSVEKDSVSVKIETSSGFSTNLTVIETFEHSGSFRSVVKPVYFEDAQALADFNAVPVKYGDTITFTYRSPESGEELKSSVLIHKGADGEVTAFTKQYADPETAVKTQFTIAEAFFELAKKHRSLGQTSLARREIEQGRRLLEEVIRDFPHIETRAQADYLLADLALEYGDDAVDDKIKREKYLEAINLFTSVIISYPDSIYAPRSQYKKALTFEKMGDIDKACEEYVKLSYTYPDNELVAETIARLGTYFSTKGKELEIKSAQASSEEERETIDAQAKAMFKTAADVFSRLAPRFPTHELSGKTLVLSGQCYIRAGDFARATDVLGEAINNYADNHELVAEAMYWRGDAFMKMEALEDAYRQFKKLTWDHPSSKWAKFARGRLTERALDAIHAKETQ